MKKQTKVLKTRLTAAKLTWEDLLVISHAVIKARTKATEEAQACAVTGMDARMTTFLNYAAQYNRVLQRLNHPAAITQPEE